MAGSLLARGAVLDFAVSRALRIYPALIAMVLVTVSLGLLVTTLPWYAYLSDPQTASYLLRNTSMFGGAAYQLPGVFENNPLPKTVNGSLWTLPWELRLYAALAVMWLGLLMFRSGRQRLMNVCVVLVSLASLLVFVLSKLAPGVLPASMVFENRFVPTFFLGAACNVLRHRITLNTTAFACCATAWIVGAAILDPARFLVLHIMLLPYLVLHLAYVPQGNLRRFNDLGDYSYGVYIYAFPVQQTVVFLLPGVSVGVMTWLAFPATLACAWCSWHFLEARVLGKKEATIRAIQDIVSGISSPDRNTGLGRNSGPDATSSDLVTAVLDGQDVRSAPSPDVHRH